MKKWNILAQAKSKKQKAKSIASEELINILLENRGIKTKKEVEDFLNPKLEDVISKSVGIDQKQLKKAVARIKKAIENKEQIVVFGDYDVDGICGTAILWETLYSLGAKVLPYIPHRIDEGYGFSIKAIQSSEFKIQNPSLVITVDNGIVANDAVDFAKKQGIDVIITDHHVPSKNPPKAYAIFHTTKLCGTAVAYMLAQEIKITTQNPKILNTKYDLPAGKAGIQDTHLELVALATVADMVPLTGSNRTLLKFGLEKLRKTKRVGFIELFKEAVINPQDIDTYQIGHVIAPRINAAGRIEHAMDSLRLLCTNNKEKAEILAFKLGSTNKERQLITQEAAQHAVLRVKNLARVKNLIFIAHESYQQGVIGLVAGRLVEEFYRPSIVVSIGATHSKASARSVAGFNIIEFIRSASAHLIDAGGHPMAAGFTVETAKLSLLQKTLEDSAHDLITDDLLMRTLRVDCEISLNIIDETFYSKLQNLAPFGMGNPEPTFVSRGITIEDMRLVGKEGKHVKFSFIHAQPLGLPHEKLSGIGFGLGERSSEFHIGDKVDIVYTINKNVWNGNSTLQLKIRDIKISDSN